LNDSLTIGLLLLSCLAPGTLVPTVKCNNFVARTLQAYSSGPRNGVPVRSGLL